MLFLLGQMQLNENDQFTKEHFSIEIDSIGHWKKKVFFVFVFLSNLWRIEGMCSCV